MWSWRTNTGKCWLHSCGNLKGIMGVLIGDVKIDDLHSFQEEIIPVT
ncbi:MAG: hypothetical protein NUW12_11900 [Firmicutes bacterium]|nr:hypothetical protein [Bacillota bacterium]